MGSQFPRLRNASDPTQVFQQLKQRLHQQIIIQMEPRYSARNADNLRRELANATIRICREHSIQLSQEDEELLIQEILNEAFGYGPLDPLIRDPEVSDILVNGASNVYVERDGILHATDVKFADDETLISFIQRLVSRAGRRIDDSSPMVDAHLPDGSRLNAVIPPLSLRGPSLSIRKFRPEPFKLEQLVHLGSLSRPMAEFLSKAVEGRVSIMFSGGTGTGKTTLLNCLSRFIPRSERVITIEHTAELQLQQPDVVSLEARPPNIEGRGEIMVRDLVKNSLRMRPDRIIVGECRGGEVFDVLQAMITGHDGSMTTIHASNTREALHRMELMIALSGVELPRDSARRYIASAVQLLVHLRRFPTGERRIVQVSEVCGVDNDYIIEDIFKFHSHGTDKFGNLQGEFMPSGYVPAVLQQMRDFGIECSPDLFQKRELTVQDN